MEQKKRDFLKESALAWEAAWVIDGWIGRVGHSAHPLCDLRNALGESAYTLAEKGAIRMAEIHWTKTEATIAGEPHLSYAAEMKGDGYMVRRARTDGRPVWIATKRCERIGGGFATSDEAIEACHAVAGVKRRSLPAPRPRSPAPPGPGRAAKPEKHRPWAGGQAPKSPS